MPTETIPKSRIDRVEALREELEKLANNKDKKGQKDKLKPFLDQFRSEDYAAWVRDGLLEEAVVFSEFLGYYLVIADLTTAQIRNFFGEVRRIQMRGYNEQDFLMLKPRLAYATKRKETEGSRKFQTVMNPAIDAVVQGTDLEDKERRFVNFVNFFEAILAYHRASGGK